MTNTTLKLEINSLPIELREEVAHFIEFLKTKSKTKEHPKQREFGFGKGRVFTSEDFDDPIDSFREYM